MIEIIVSKKKILFDDYKIKIKKTTGAIVTFTGIVKETNYNKKVDGIYYYVFDNLFYFLLKKQTLFFLKDRKDIKIYIKQYSGYLTIGEINLIILACSSKRKDSFIICHKLLEFIKSKAPIWKKEIYQDKTFKWINA